MNLRTAVIGCGNISRFHFDGIEKAGGKIAAVCDLDRGAAEPYVTKHDCRFEPDWRNLTDDPGIDILHVTLVSRLHKEICLRAIEQGKSVICEKTLTENPVDSLEIVRAARKVGTIFYTSYMKRFIPAVEKAVDLLPRLGRLMGSSIHSYQSWGDNWRGVPAGDFFKRERDRASPVKSAYGGGILVCGGSHILDLICYIFGRPTSLFATQYEPEYLDLDLEATALIKTPMCPVQFQALAHPLNKIGFLKDGWDEGFTVTGTDGTIELLSSNWSDVETKSSRLLYYDNQTGQTTEYLFDAVSPFARAIAYFYDNIRQGRQGGQSPATGYDVDKLIASISESARSGQAVEIDWEIEL